MTSRFTLTPEQCRAAAAQVERAFIVADPGSGKTTVAAERYGVARYSGDSDPRRILALSFTRSATWELARQIRRRWGTSALGWLNKVTTLDGLHCELVTHLLRSGRLQWPGGHTHLVVIDTWRGQVGAHYLLPRYGYRRVASVQGVRVTSFGRRITIARYGIGRRDAFETHLRNGVCTHEEVRDVLRSVLHNADFRAELSAYLATTVKALIVDEVFDANDLDLDIVLLAADAGVATTLIGDPWQALYEFRGAQPDLVPQFVEEHGFQTFPITQSFRFKSAEMQRMAADLRASRPVSVPAGSADAVNVVLAAEWNTLWRAADCVLPLSFGGIDNQSDAAIVLLLDQLVMSHFRRNAIFAAEAITLLCLDPETIRSDGPTAFATVLETLSAGTAEAASAAIDQLRVTLRDLGSPRQLRRLQPTGEAEQLERLRALARRMNAPLLVAGMTVHQAKGQEWPIVGVAFTPAQIDRLTVGLSPDNADDRLLYVALTRSCIAARLV